MSITIRRAATPREIAEACAVIRTSMIRDQGYGYQPQWHWDLDHAQEMYVDNPRHALLVAEAGDTVLGTCGVRIGGPAHPGWLADRYADRQRVGQITRLVTVPAARRRGLGRRLVEATLDHMRADGGYRVAYLHTNAKTAGALEFWRTSGFMQVYDARSDEDDPRFETVHFERSL